MRKNQQTRKYGRAVHLEQLVIQWLFNEERTEPEDQQHLLLYQAKNSKFVQGSLETFSLDEVIVQDTCSHIVESPVN